MKIKVWYVLISFWMCQRRTHGQLHLVWKRERSDSDCTRTFVWNISVWRRTRFVPFIFSLHDQLLQYFYQFLTENIKFNSFWFPSTWWFPVSWVFFKYWPAKKCQQRHNIFGVCSSWPGFSFKMCNFSEFDEDWRSEQHIK